MKQEIWIWIYPVFIFMFWNVCKWLHILLDDASFAFKKKNISENFDTKTVCNS